MPGPDRPTLLLVEDDEDSRALLAELLEDQFQVETAPDGPAGLLRFERVHPAVVLTDESLPGMSGTALAREVKSRDPAAKVVLVSGHLRPLQTEACDAVLRKPIDLEQLHHALDDLVHPGTS